MLLDLAKNIPLLEFENAQIMYYTLAFLTPLSFKPPLKKNVSTAIQLSLFVNISMVPDLA